MKPETVKKRIGAMANRWERDLDSLRRMFPAIDWDDATDATEVVRNLATAIKYADSFAAMSPNGIEGEIEYHRAPRQDQEEPHDPSRYCALDACKREGCTHLADACLSMQPLPHS